MKIRTIWTIRTIGSVKVIKTQPLLQVLVL